MDLIQLTVIKQNGKFLSAPIIAGFAVKDIVSPITSNTVHSVFIGKTLTEIPNTDQNMGHVTYEVSETLAAIAVLSEKLFLADVIKRNSATISYQAVFVAEAIYGPLNSITAGTEFLYKETGAINLIDYWVSQTVPQIITQTNSNFANVVITNYAGVLALQTGSTLVNGTYYLISDFATSHVIPNMPPNSTVNPNHIGTTEPLLVFATSATTLDKKAYSILNADDYIEYDLIDTTSANPNDGSSKGRISFRKNTTENVSTWYDFRNVVFYHSSTTYDFTGKVFPVTPNSIVRNGITLGFSAGSGATLALFGKSLETAFPGLLITATNGNILTIWSVSGNEYGTLNVTDSAPTTTNVPGTITKSLYYTFGNDVNFSTSPF